MASPADQSSFREHSFIEQAREQVQQLFKPRPPPWAAAEARDNGGDNAGGVDHAAPSPSASLEVRSAPFAPMRFRVSSACTAGEETESQGVVLLSCRPRSFVLRAGFHPHLRHAPVGQSRTASVRVAEASPEMLQVSCAHGTGRSCSLGRVRYHAQHSSLYTLKTCAYSPLQMQCRQTMRMTGC